MGHIELVVPVAHIWYFRSLPNKIGYLLGLPTKKLDQIIYYERYVVIQPGVKAEDQIRINDFLTEDEYLDIIDKLPEFTNIKLCEIIISDRYLSLNQKLALECMQELSKRRINGDNFNFEEYIEQKFEELPKINVNLLDLSGVLNQVVSGFVKWIKYY